MKIKEINKFIDDIPNHVYESGLKHMKKAMKGVDFDDELKSSISESAKITIGMATRVLLDVGADIKWPVAPKKHIKVGPKKYTTKLPKKGKK